MKRKRTLFKTVSCCYFSSNVFELLLWSPFCRIFLLQLTCSLALEWNEVGKISPGLHPDHSHLPLRMICFCKNIFIFTIQESCHCSSFYTKIVYPLYWNPRSLCYLMCQCNNNKEALGLYLAMAYLKTIRNGSNLGRSGTNYTSLFLLHNATNWWKNRSIKMDSTPWTILICSDLVVRIGFWLSWDICLTWTCGPGLFDQSILKTSSEIVLIINR